MSGFEWDRQLFTLINQSWANELFDWLLPNITDVHRSWLAMAIVATLCAYWLYRQKQGAIRAILVVALAVGISDAFTYRVAKAAVRRPRPEFSGLAVHLRTFHHSGYSFPSNHAANSFAIATALSLALPWLAPIFVGIAFTIAYSRVYVGVHFPLDVMAGAAIGALSALLAAWVIHRLWLRIAKQLAAAKS